MNDQDKNQKSSGLFTSLGRRAMLKIAGAAGVGLPLAAYLGGRAPWQGIRAANAQEGPRERETYWHDRGDYFVQETVDVSDADSNVIRARVEGEWRQYMNRELSQDFIDWNVGARLDLLSDPMGFMCLDGPHSGCLATYGANRGDSVFTLNAAFKGFGFFPKEDRIDDCIDEVTRSWGAGDMTRLGVLRDFYEDRSMWDFRYLSSLELYTEQDFETHSFLNQMANPVAVINYLDIPGSFEVRTIARLLHPRDPDLTDLELKMVRWVNLMHDFYHCPTCSDPDDEYARYIACQYYVVEVFDNSPYPGRMGARSLPAL